MVSLARVFACYRSPPDTAITKERWVARSHCDRLFRSVHVLRRFVSMRMRWSVSLVLMLVGGAVLVLLFSFAEERRSAEAAFGRQVADVADDRPGFVFVQHAFPPGHPGEANAVVDDPFQLSIGVVLH